MPDAATVASGVEKTKPSVCDVPLEERILRAHRMFPGGAAIFAEKGWGAAEGLEECARCHAGTVWRDPSGVPLHPWCGRGNPWA